MITINAGVDDCHANALAGDRRKPEQPGLHDLGAAEFDGDPARTVVDPRGVDDLGADLATLQEAGIGARPDGDVLRVDLAPAEAA